MQSFGTESGMKGIPPPQAWVVSGRRFALSTIAMKGESTNPTLTPLDKRKHGRSQPNRGHQRTRKRKRCGRKEVDGHGNEYLGRGL
ncbi:hypothetical protein ZHAS_00004582 [Anopheles sinensis]|uniref:Uncharacterized protein n=1 Tax=Anopheles sinensis TaxID=74873 RepID=A0A084VHK3_ANOSI|nr:hypothetical protein ZHAS_00004582 [Anopheles sinensis]